MSESLPQLVMIRERLADLPDIALAEPYGVSGLRSGEEQDWEKIIGESFQAEFSFSESMSKDTEFRPDRVIMLRDGKRPVATASAWFREAYGEETGYLHMVGMLPAYAGRGLGAQASLAALLHTDDHRLPAIKTYVRLGFVPKLEHDSHAGRWREVAERFKDSPERDILTAGLK